MISWDFAGFWRLLADRSANRYDSERNRSMAATFSIAAIWEGSAFLETVTEDI